MKIQRETPSEFEWLGDNFNITMTGEELFLFFMLSYWNEGKGNYPQQNVGRFAKQIETALNDQGINFNPRELFSRFRNGRYVG